MLSLRAHGQICFYSKDYALAFTSKSTQTFNYYWRDFLLESPWSLSSIVSGFFLFFADTNFEVLNNSLHDL